MFIKQIGFEYKENKIVFECVQEKYLLGIKVLKIDNKN